MNKNIQMRDTIIFGRYDKDAYICGIRMFKQMNSTTLNRLLENDFIDLDFAQNNAPTNKELIDFLKTHNNFLLSGYTVTDKRNDYRVSFDLIECISLDEATQQDKEDFEKLCKYASNYYNDTDLCAWWD